MEHNAFIYYYYDNLLPLHHIVDFNVDKIIFLSNIIQFINYIQDIYLLFVMILLIIQHIDYILYPLEKQYVLDYYH